MRIDIIVLFFIWEGWDDEKEDEIDCVVLGVV